LFWYLSFGQPAIRNGLRDALTGRCETFDSDGCRHDSHRAKVHDPGDKHVPFWVPAMAAAFTVLTSHDGERKMAEHRAPERDESSKHLTCCPLGFKRSSRGCEAILL